VPDRYRGFDDQESVRSDAFRQGPPKFLTAIRESFKDGYSLKTFSADLMAGAVVALVALPLSMALGIASGVAPQHGIYTAIIAGFVVALLGGSRFQVTGPTAAFVVILAPIVNQFGFAGLLIAGLMAGVLLLLMGLFRFGRFIEFIPHPVITGFTSGIAVVIGVIQFKDFFGLRIEKMPDSFFERIQTLLEAAPTASKTEFFIGLATLFLLIAWPRAWASKLPSPLVALGLAAVGNAMIKKFHPEFSVATIQSQFSYLKDGITVSGIPQSAPHFQIPWMQVDGGVTWDLIRHLLPSAFAIAMLGAIESLLSAVVADGMAKTKHDSDGELLALGIGNILCPFFGGIPATGAIARTATNIRFGARSPASSMLHAVFIFTIVLLFAPLIGYLPMASLAALLLLVAYNMADLPHFFRILKIAPLSDVAVLVICFSLTVIFDMVIGVTAGVVLASFLFMARMATVTRAYRIVPDRHPRVGESLPREIMIYEIAGPLFFGAAHQAVNAISQISDEVRVIIFDLHDVPMLDVSGLVALESCIRKLQAQNKMAILTRIQKQPASVILKTDLLIDTKRTFLSHTIEDAVAQAKRFISDAPSAPPKSQPSL
jgi:SulP family sulfate permease